MRITRENVLNIICGAVLIFVMAAGVVNYAVQPDGGGKLLEKTSKQSKIADQKGGEIASGEKEVQKLPANAAAEIVSQSAVIAGEAIAQAAKEAEEARIQTAAADAAYLAAQQNVSRGGSRVEMQLPSVDTSFKAYMDYRMITSRTSPQYRFQQECWTDEQGLRRHGEDYCVALGSYYSTNIGDRFEITLAEGKTFTAVLSDVKSDAHTDQSRMYRPATTGADNLIEFIVDTNRMSSAVRTAGSVGAAGFPGSVSKIVKLEP